MSRTAAVARGLAALLVLLGLLVGVPLWLTTVAGSPVPEVLPNWEQVWSGLTSRDDGTLLLGVLKYLAWAGWALFAASVLVDLIARLRGIPVPRLGPQQHLASGLVTAVAALAVIVPTAATATSTAVTVATAPATASASPADARAPWVETLAAPSPLVEPAAVHDQAQGFTSYTVRQGDCLWDIAWNELGDPERWPELYEASRDLEQPDGRRITDPDLIYPGWVIHVPAPGKARRPNTQTPGGTQREQSPSASPESDVEDLILTPLSGTLASTPARSLESPRSRPPSAPQPSTDHPVHTPMNGLFDSSTGKTSAQWRASLTARDRHAQRDWRTSLAQAPDQSA